MSSFPSQESRPLKRSARLGPPDVYPQFPEQREDSMSADIVHEGFQSSKPPWEEHLSMRTFKNPPTAANVWAFFQDIKSKKKEANTCPDTIKSKKFLSLKDSFINPIDKNKDQIDNWFKDLAGSAPLSRLAKRAPLYNKKEDVLQELYKNDVPITRAVWLVKMTAMHTNLMAESNKKKKGATMDPSTEWALVIGRLLVEILNKLDDAPPPAVSSDPMCPIEDSSQKFHRQWRYLFDLMIAMYDGDLLDHSEVLTWFVETLEKLSVDHKDLDSSLKFFLPFVLEMGPRFPESEVITRRLLYWVCNTFSEIILVDPQVQPYVDSIPAFQSLMENYLELNSCPLHRTVVLCLSGLIMGLCQQCPLAVVWNDVKEEEYSYLQGSPLDILPCSLATLPSPPGPESYFLRDCLKFLESSVIERSVMAEKCWYKKPNNTVDENIKNLLRVLDAMDRHDYNKVDKDNSMDTLFHQVFGGERNLAQNQQLVMFLCEWVVSSTRTGMHRPIVVATLLEMLAEPYETGAKIFQETLIKFLDTKAPQLDNIVGVDSEQFKNLVSLFGELIDREVFSHDNYVSTFIARGVFETGGQPLALPSLNTQQHSVKSEVSEDLNSFDNPDSVLSECSGFAGQNSIMHVDYKRHTRHVQYLLHFPLPQDESYAHEQNQRFQLLYGVGRSRDLARYAIKRLVRDICKLFNKKTYLIDVVQGEMGKRKRKDQQRDDGMIIDGIHEEITRRFKMLTYYDMESVISQCIPVFSDVFLRGNSNQGKNVTTDRSHLYLPVPSTVSAFFELIEMSLNITCLLQTVTDTLSKLQRLIEIHFRNKSRCMIMYQSVLCLHVIGILRKYQAVLMTMEDVEKLAFKQLIHLVRQVGDPTQCTSTDRCILAYLHDLFQSSHLIQHSFSQVYGKASTKVNNALFSSLEPAKGRGTLIETYADELIQSSAKGVPLNISGLGEDMKLNFDRYSFVCNVILFICQTQNLEHVNNVCVLSAEMTAMYSLLPPEWLGALYTVLSPKSTASGYLDLTKRINTNDTGIYDGLAMLVGTLLARQCFTVAAFVQHVICPAMIQGVDQSCAPVDPQIEPTIRLACHILHRLFTVEYCNGAGRVMSVGNLPFKLSEPLLLTGALQKVSTEFLVDILKMLIVHGDKANASVKKNKDLIENLYESMIASGSEEKVESIDVKTMKLGEFTQRVLREICNVPWVRERFSKETSSRLIRENVLIDKNFSNSQARNLLNIICRPSESPWLDIGADVSNAMTRLLRNLDLWTLRFNYMELQLLLTQMPTGQQTEVLETVAKAIVDLFQLQAETHISTTSEPGIPAVHLPEDNSSWLVPPLINRLPVSLKAQIIKAASEKLESAKNFWSHKNDQEKERNLQRSSVVLVHPPFLTLLLNCLETEENKNEMLKSLKLQIDYFICNVKETEDKGPDDLRIRQILLECLQVRLGLVGNLFPHIQADMDRSVDWAYLLAQLITFSVVEVHSTQELFHTVVDMLSTLLHTLIAHDRKAYLSVAKRILKLTDRMSEGIDLIKPLLPVVKANYEVIAVTPNKLSRNKRTRKEGYTMQKKERQNPWEVIEGVKNIFSLSWFGAVRTELHSPRVEEQATLLLSHEHWSNMQKTPSYFLSAPEMVPEALDPPDKQDAAILPPVAVIKKEEPPVKAETRPPPAKRKRPAQRPRSTATQNRNTSSPSTAAFQVNIRPPSFPEAVNQHPDYYNQFYNQPAHFRHQQPVSQQRSGLRHRFPAGQVRQQLNAVIRTQGAGRQQHLEPLYQQHAMPAPNPPAYSQVPVLDDPQAAGYMPHPNYQLSRQFSAESNMPYQQTQQQAPQNTYMVQRGSQQQPSQQSHPGQTPHYTHSYSNY